MFKRIKAISLQEWAEAVGLSLGRARRKTVPILSRQWKRIVILVLILVAAWNIPRGIAAVSEFLATLPSISLSVVLAIGVAGFFLCAAAGFIYVLFLYLDRILSAVNGSTQQIATMRMPLQVGRRPKQEPLTPEDVAGSYHESSEERQFLQEEFDRLKQAGVLKGHDLDEVLKEGGAAEFDFAAMKASMRGTEV